MAVAGLAMAAILLSRLDMRRSLAFLPLSLLAWAGCDDHDGPKDRVLAKTTQLVQYQNCSQLEADLKQMVIYETWASIDQAGYWGWGGGIEDASSDGAPDSGGGRQEGVDYSGTNNQEEGVDEADFVKTDGYHIYTLNGNRLHIMGVPEFGQLTAGSVTEIEGHPRQMLLDSARNRLVVFSFIDTWNLPDEHPLAQLVGKTGNDDDGWYYRVKSLSKITVLDISNKAAPALVREVFYEGWYNTARKVDSSIRMSGYSYISPAITWNWWRLYQQLGQDKAATKSAVASHVNGLPLSDFIPRIYVRMPNGHFETNSLSDNACRSFYRPTDSHARGISSIISFNLLGNSLHWDADHVVSNWATFYQSKDVLLLAENAHDWWWFWWFQNDPDQLNIHAFDVSVPGQTSYMGSGRVEGQLVNQFALDEDNGAIRVATTTGFWGRWWMDPEDRPAIQNHVWVLEDHGPRLNIVGHIGGIAPNERIMSARFQGNKGYLVTFELIDPLFTLDLSVRTNPRVIGELKVPGFSTYLHPIAAGKLLAIGIDGLERWRTQISLFDVSDFAKPTLQQALPIEADHSWGWSEALYDHKAFQYWAPKKLLAVPQSTYAYTSQHGYRYLSELVLVGVDPTTGLNIHGKIDHSAYYMTDPSVWWRYVDIRRSIFMGDYVYAISDKAITAHRTSDLVKVAEQTLPGYSSNDWYWWW
jgi:hypothetical protein